LPTFQSLHYSQDLVIGWTNPFIINHLSLHSGHLPSIYSTFPVKNASFSSSVITIVIWCPHLLQGLFKNIIYSSPKSKVNSLPYLGLSHNEHSFLINSYILLSLQNILQFSHTNPIARIFFFTRLAFLSSCTFSYLSNLVPFPILPLQLSLCSTTKVRST
jgi:hypothetical protein